MTEAPDYEIYKDDETGLYVARHPNLPVSSCGDTEDEALANAREAVELYEEPVGDDLPDYDMSEMMDRVTDAEDIEEMMEGDNGDESDKQILHIVADSIGDPRYCPECDSKLEIEWDDDERGDRKCPECGNRYMEYTIDYLKETKEMQSREELMKQNDTPEILKNDSIAFDEDIDVMRVGVDLRMERLSDKSVYVAGYGGGDDGDLDYRYWFTCTEDGLEIGREIIRDD